MKQYVARFSPALLVALVLLILTPALVAMPQHAGGTPVYQDQPIHFSRGLAWLITVLSSGIAGLTISFYARNNTGLNVAASSSPLTSIQASQVFTQKALVAFLDADVQALFTHNWGLDASAPTFFDPEIFAAGYGVANVAGTYQAAFSYDFSNTNVVKINKLNFLGSGGTYVFTARKPHSVGQ
jgi:hypothetical protein